MTDDLITAFIAYVDRVEKRYGRDKYATHYLIDAQQAKAVRDELKRFADAQRSLFNVDKTHEHRHK